MFVVATDEGGGGYMPTARRMPVTDIPTRYRAIPLRIDSLLTQQSHAIARRRRARR